MQYTTDLKRINLILMSCHLTMKVNNTKIILNVLKYHCSREKNDITVGLRARKH